MRDFVFLMRRAVEEDGTILTKIIFRILCLVAAILSYPFKVVWGLCEIVCAFFSPWFKPENAFQTGLFIGFACPILLVPVLVVVTVKKWREDRQDPIWYHA